MILSLSLQPVGDRCTGGTCVIATPAAPVAQVLSERGVMFPLGAVEVGVVEGVTGVGVVEGVTCNNSCTADESNPVFPRVNVLPHK